MKETIYTIPLMDAFRSGYDCPFCFIKDKIENDGLTYFLGDSLMQSEGRELTNEHGFCGEHWEKLFNSKQNVLGLALIMDTYLQGFNKEFKALAKDAIEEYDELKDTNGAKNALVSLVKNTVGSKNKGGSKNGTDDNIKGGLHGNRAEKFYRFVSTKHEDCTLCKRIDDEMIRYIDNFFYMWSKDDDFRKLFDEAEGFCMDHFLMLIQGANKHLAPKQEGEFVPALIRKQYACMCALQKDVNWFTKKFDYRNNDKPWENAKDAPQRTIRRLHSSDLGREEK